MIVKIHSGINKVSNAYPATTQTITFPIALESASVATNTIFSMFKCHILIVALRLPLGMIRSGFSPHRDQAGHGAADRWTAQLQDAATVDRFSFQGLSGSDGEPVKDLNDLLKSSREPSIV
jgi:hypothetical protein